MITTTEEMYLCVEMFNIAGHTRVRRYKKKTEELLIKDAQWYLDRSAKFDVWAERHIVSRSIERVEMPHGDKDK